MVIVMVMVMTMFFPVQIRYSTELCFVQKVRGTSSVLQGSKKSDNHSFSKAVISSSVNLGFIQGYKSILFCISGWQEPGLS